jgi:hypothetical protein
MTNVSRKENIEVTTKLKINRNRIGKNPIDVQREWRHRNRRHLRFSKATTNETTGQKASPEREGGRTMRDELEHNCGLQLAAKK